MMATMNKPEREDTSYYDEIIKQIKTKDSHEFTQEQDEENDIIYENMIDQFKQDPTGIELKLCLKSYIIDYFLYNCKLKYFNDIFTLICVDQRLATYIYDVKLSRAIELCLLCLGEKISNTKDIDESLKDNLKNSLKKLGDFFVDNFDGVLNDQYAIYPLRTFIRIISTNANDEFDVKQLLEHKSTSNITLQKKKQQRRQYGGGGGGNDEDEDNDRKFKMRLTNIKELPFDWKLSKFLKKFYTVIVGYSNILEFALVAHISPLLTLLMRKLRTVEKYELLGDEFIEKIDEKFQNKPNSFQGLIQDAIGSRFIEMFLYCAPSTVKLHYITECLVPNVVKYSKHIYANYPIQTLLKTIRKEDTELKVLYDELLGNIDEIINLQTDLTFKHFMLIELIQTCKRNSYDSKKLIKELRKFYGCNEKERRIDFLRLLLISQKYEDATKEYGIKETLYMYDVKPIACTITQKLIELSSVNGGTDQSGEESGTSVLDCLNDLNSNELEHLSTNSIGSHFIQDCLNYFYKDKNLSQINLLFGKMKGRLLNICCSKSGSFVMETLWSITSIQQKVEICEELKDNELDLKRDQYARFFANKVGINFFKRRQSEWIQIQKSEMKKREMFAELYDTYQEPKKENNNKANSKNKWNNSYDSKKRGGNGGNSFFNKIDNKRKKV